MSEVTRLHPPECERARNLLPQFVDGDLTLEQSTWFRSHLDTCPECNAALAGFAEIDCELTGWGQRLGWQHPAPAGARAQLSGKLGLLAARRHALGWIPPAIGAIAAAWLLAVFVPQKIPPAAPARPTQFVEIPYLPPLDPHENTMIVRMDIKIATLIAAGYRVTGDPDAVVPADVLVGEDGRAHAVRVLSGIEWNGTGD